MTGLSERVMKRLSGGRGVRCLFVYASTTYGQFYCHALDMYWWGWCDQCLRYIGKNIVMAVINCTACNVLLMPTTIVGFLAIYNLF